MSSKEAFKLSQDAGLDLVEISPNAEPPVVKIIDWGKFQYQKMKEQQKNKRKAKQVELKQMRFGLKIGSGDLEIKLRKVKKFLEAGNKVKIQIVLRVAKWLTKKLVSKWLIRLFPFLRIILSSNSNLRWLAAI